MNFERTNERLSGQQKACVQNRLHRKTNDNNNRKIMVITIVSQMNWEFIDSPRKMDGSYQYTLNRQNIVRTTYNEAQKPNEEEHNFVILAGENDFLHRANISFNMKAI